MIHGMAYSGFRTSSALGSDFSVTVGFCVGRELVVVFRDEDQSSFLQRVKNEISSFDPIPTKKVYSRYLPPLPSTTMAATTSSSAAGDDPPRPLDTEEEEDASSAMRQKLMSSEEVYVYKIPPLKTAGGHRYVLEYPTMLHPEHLISASERDRGSLPFDSIGGSSHFIPSETKR